MLEAMKMQTVVQAPMNGVVSEIVLSEGQRVDVGELLVCLEP